MLVAVAGHTQRGISGISQPPICHSHRLIYRLIYHLIPGVSIYETTDNRESIVVRDMIYNIGSM